MVNQHGVNTTTPRPCASLPVCAPAQPATVFQQFQDTTALGVPQNFNQISTVAGMCVNSSPSPSQVATVTALPANWLTPPGREQEMTEKNQLAVAATVQHCSQVANKSEGVGPRPEVKSDRSVLANLYLLAKDHNAQITSKV